MKTKNTPHFALFRHYAARYKGPILRLTLIYIASTALLVLAPRALSRYIDSIGSGGTLIAIILYLAAMLAQAVIASLLDYQLTDLGQHFTDDYRRDILAHYLSLSVKHISGIPAGEMMTRLHEDAQGLFKYYYVLIYKLAGSGLALVFILWALLFEVGWLCAALLLVSILSILLFKIIQDRGIKKYLRHSKANAAFNGIMKEMLDNAPDLRAVHAEQYAEDQMHSAMRVRFREGFPASLMYANLWSASTVVESLLVGSGLALAAFLWDGGTITLGTAYLIYTYCELIISPLQDFRNHMGDMQGAKAGILRTGAFLDLPKVAAAGSLRLKGGPLSVDIEDVHFTYEDDEEVLKGVSLKIPAGGRLGIMGETGCGKSTLISLIARMNPCAHGTIRIGGVDVREADFQSLRSRVAYITQRPQLIHGTIRDNIALFSKDYTDQDIFEAMALLGLADWFSRFPEGLDTDLSAGEDNLSVGEAQLIALIRLALRKPGLVLLDEITANLDAATESRVLSAMEALLQGRTVIAIAHRKEALSRMDKIVAMKGGVIL